MQHIYLVLISFTLDKVNRSDTLPSTSLGRLSADPYLLPPEDGLPVCPRAVLFQHTSAEPGSLTSADSVLYHLL